MNNLLSNSLLIASLLLCVACNGQKANNSTPNDPQLVFSDSTKLFFSTVSTQYVNAAGSVINIDKTASSFTLVYPYHTTPRYLAQPVPNCKKISSCLCNTKGCYRLDLSVLPCEVQLTGKVGAVFAAPDFPGYASQIILEDVQIQLNYSDSFVEKSKTAALGTYPEQQKFYCENLADQLKAESSNLKSSFDSKTLRIFPKPNLGLITQVKQADIPEETSYLKK